MFLYITLFFQNVLGFSPFEAGLRSLPVTGPILFVSPLSGRLTARVPVRLLLGTGLAFVTVGLLLMGNLSDSSEWTALLPGQSMASGANNTARQLGLATGIAGLGSIFQSKIESTLTPLVGARPRHRTSTSSRGRWRQAGPGARCRPCRSPTGTRWCTLHTTRS
jgi:hypothetical protein